MKKTLQISSILLSTIMLITIVPAFAIEYQTTTDDSKTECRNDQTLMFRHYSKNYFCLDNDSVTQWVELGLAKVVKINIESSEDTPQTKGGTTEEIGCKEGFLPILRFEHEGAICTPEQTALLWSQLGIAEILVENDIVENSKSCKQFMTLIFREDTKSYLCVNYDTAKGWSERGIATIVQGKIVEDEKEIMDEVICGEGNVKVFRYAANNDICVSKSIANEWIALGLAEISTKTTIDDKKIVEDEKEMKDEVKDERVIKEIPVTDSSSVDEFESQMSQIYNFYVISSSTTIDSQSIKAISTTCKDGDFAISGGYTVSGLGDVEILESKPIMKNSESSAWQIKAFNDDENEMMIIVYAVCSAF